jgi:tetratricopeptide (TPR) repeat protein
LIIAITATQVGLSAVAQPLSPPNSTPSSSSALVAGALQEFAGFHFRRAERLFVSALAQTSAAEDQIATIEIMHKLARTHELLSQYDEAEKNLATAVVWSEKISRTGRNAALASSLSKLGALDLTMADYKNARAELEKCLTLAGQDNVGSGIRAKVLDTLAELDLAQGNWQKARENSDSCLALTESVFGKQSLEYAEALNTSAMSDLFLGRETQALEELSRALSSLESMQRDPETDSARITSLTDLCQVYLSKERPTEALQAAARAADMAVRSFGQDSPTTAHCMFLQGLAYVQGNEPVTAKKYLDLSLATAKAKLPAGHPEISLALFQLGLCAILQKNLEQAESYCDQASKVKPGSSSNVLVSECKQTFADYFWRHGEILGGLRMGGWRVLSRQLQTLSTPVGKVCKAMLPGYHDKCGPLENAGYLVFLLACLLVPLLAVGAFLYLTMHMKLFETGSAGGSILAVLRHKQSNNYTPRGYKLVRPQDKPAQTILDKHRGRTGEHDGVRNATVNWK